ncbi:MAG: nucleotidyltransferase family protein, partial [Bacteroidales bacterium]|nr:nucleotidyltransferase family protein [Bacteroidales bacterium]
MNFNHEQNTLFLLIKTSLCLDKNREAFLDIPEDLDWNSLVNLAAKQGVLCVARDGLVQMEGLSRELLIRWELSIQKLEARNKRQRAVIKELVALFREN